MKTLVIISLVLATQFSRAAESDIVIADFEGETYSNWTTAGGAFGQGPARGTLPGQQQVSGFQGKGLVNSFLGGDDAKGTLTSPTFKIERRFITFLVGGGTKDAKTCINLLVDGKVVRTAVGENAENLGPIAWDVREFAGRMAQIQVVDDASGGMGHILVDQIVQTDKSGQLIANATREFTAEKHYLNIPQSSTGDKRRVTLLVDGKPESASSNFGMVVADGKPDWWAPYDISRLKGKRIGLRADKLPEDSTALQRVEQSDEIKDAAGAYQSGRRPQLYFSPLRGGCGDANGLVYYEGEYHLFFQHNPFGPNGGENSHWGHAVSKDLVHWEEMPDALLPDDLGLQYSGSGLVDTDNTAGLQTGQEKTIILIYSAAGRPNGPTQCLAYSNDRGRTWTKFPGNPVLPLVEPHNRDPKVFWYAPEKKWVMALCFGHDSRQNGGKPTTNPNYGLFASKDLKSWERMSDLFIDNTCDCPEFFEIAVDGDTSRTKWIFYTGDALYLVGSFDGKKFTPESGPHKLNLGNAFYASQTFNNMPEKDGRRILMANCAGGGENSGFWGAISIPVELTLRTTDEGLRLYTSPVKELESLRTKTHEVAPQALKPGVNPLAGVRGELLEVVADLVVGNASTITFNLRGVPVVYDAAKQELTCQNRTVPLKPVGGHLRLRAYVDRTAIFLFVNDGRIYMPMGLTTPKENLSLDLSAHGDGAAIQSMQVHELESIWKPSRK
jgi:fructan beta-fructosidase